MQWNIENSLVCPVTGTGFSVAASAKNLKLIIWYSGDYFLSIGSVINITQNEVFINGARRFTGYSCIPLYGKFVVNIFKEY
jgi:hypothetical protein